MSFELKKSIIEYAEAVNVAKHIANNSIKKNIHNLCKDGKYSFEYVNGYNKKDKEIVIQIIKEELEKDCFEVQKDNDNLYISWANASRGFAKQCRDRSDMQPKFEERKKLLISQLKDKIRESRDTNVVSIDMSVFGNYIKDMTDFLVEEGFQIKSQTNNYFSICFGF